MTGLRLKTNKIITKGDIIELCEFLNQEYLGYCEFQPEGICEGGILYKFKHEQGYKSVRLCVNFGNSFGKWYWVDDNVMSEWYRNDDMIFKADNEFDIVLKNLEGAPQFTMEEIKLWEGCFQKIGINRIGKYPSKKLLKQ